MPIESREATGTVVGQSPDAGTQLLPGSAFVLQVATPAATTPTPTGPAPTPTTEAPTPTTETPPTTEPPVTAGDYTPDGLAAAQADSDANSWDLIEIDEVDSGEPGRVLDQSPAPGTEMVSGSAPCSPSPWKPLRQSPRE